MNRKSRHPHFFVSVYFYLTGSPTMSASCLFYRMKFSYQCPCPGSPEWTGLPSASGGWPVRIGTRTFRDSRTVLRFREPRLVVGHLSSHIGAAFHRIPGKTAAIVTPSHTESHRLCCIRFFRPYYSKKSLMHPEYLQKSIKKEPDRNLVLGVGIIYLPGQSPAKYCRRRRA